MTAVDDLVTWLDQILKADMAAAQAVVDRCAPDEATIYLEDPYPEEAAFLPTVTPARTLARIAADRQILALHHPDRHLENWYWPERECAECHHRWHKWLPDKPPTEIGPEQGCPTVRLLALPYADRPGYQEAWRPA